MSSRSRQAECERMMDDEEDKYDNKEREEKALQIDNCSTLGHGDYVLFRLLDSSHFEVFCFEIFWGIKNARFEQTLRVMKFRTVNIHKPYACGLKYLPT